MEDWKSKLSALTGVPVPEATETIYEDGVTVREEQPAGEIPNCRPVEEIYA